MRHFQGRKAKRIENLNHLQNRWVTSYQRPKAVQAPTVLLPTLVHSRQPTKQPPRVKQQRTYNEPRMTNNNNGLVFLQQLARSGVCVDAINVVGRTSGRLSIHRAGRIQFVAVQGNNNTASNHRLLEARLARGSGVPGVTPSDSTVLRRDGDGKARAGGANYCTRTGRIARRNGGCAMGR